MKIREHEVRAFVKVNYQSIKTVSIEETDLKIVVWQENNLYQVKTGKLEYIWIRKQYGDFVKLIQILLNFTTLS